MRLVAVTGLGFGDEGKGAVTDHLCRVLRPSVVVRTGGPQAAHHIVGPDGRSHCCAQFGSGVLAGVPTHLSQFMIMEPLALAREATHLERVLGVTDPWNRLTVDPRVPVVTPWHRGLTRLREVLRGGNAHGSTGVGVGEVASDLANGHNLFRAVHLFYEDERSAVARLREIRDRLRFDAESLWLESSLPVGCDDGGAEAALAPDPAAWLERVRAVTDRLRVRDLAAVNLTDQLVIVESSQGILIDTVHGFPPYHSWTDATFRPADAIARELGIARSDTVHLGVLRSFLTRHGPGPFPTEDSALRSVIADDHNQTERWQGRLRVGHFDAVLADYARRVCGGCDCLALTHLDKVRDPWHLAIGYRDTVLDKYIKTIAAPVARPAELTAHLLSAEPILASVVPATADGFVATIEELLKVPIGVVSHGPTTAHKQLRGALALSCAHHASAQSTTR